MEPHNSNWNNFVALERRCQLLVATSLQTPGSARIEYSAIGTRHSRPPDLGSGDLPFPEANWKIPPSLFSKGGQFRFFFYEGQGSPAVQMTPPTTPREGVI